MLLDVKDLSLRIGAVNLLDRVSFSVDRGQVLGLVGESGSGKSLTAMALTGLVRRIGGIVTGGTITFDGQELTGLKESAYRKLRGKRIAFITQNPMSALDALKTIGDQVDQVSRLHLGLGRKAARAHTVDILTRLRIPDAATVAHAYPHQLSGGMKQRMVIAMALAADADLIVADEPTTALDVTVQAQIVMILADLVKKRNIGLILITHDMGVVAQICDQVCVLYAGRIAESGPVGQIMEAPRHPYSAALIGCIPRDDMAPGALKGIPGSVPSAADYGAECCRFASRCARADHRCTTLRPQMTPHGQALVACHHPLGSDLAGPRSSFLTPEGAHVQSR